MAESQPDETHLNGGAPLPATTSAAPAAPSAPATAATTVGSKRQRRPSVRLGEIGGEQCHHVSYDSHVRRSSGNKQWRPLSNSRKDSKASRTRTLTNLSSDYINQNETLEDEREGNLDSMAIGSWRVKKRVGSAATKRVRSNWVYKMEDNRNNGNLDQGEEKYSGEEELEDGYRDFNREDSESPLKDQSPMNSPENHGNEREREGFYPTNNRRRYKSNKDNSSIRARVSENREFQISEPSEMDGGDWRRGGGERDGVRIWLDGLGLGRYYPVFEIHEVDDEVLPLLTLEDLKDMGITAVGSRRKMYCAIQKLGKEFS